MTYDDIKSHKKQGFTASLEDTLFTKPEERVKLTHQPPFSIISPPPLLLPTVLSLNLKKLLEMKQ